MPTLTVLDIQRMSSEDGPGLRTTVFLKGCPLRCGWCHNPESIDPRREVLWHAARCMGCGSCAAVCPQGAIACPEKALAFEASGVAIDRARCVGCFACCEACPAGALEAKGLPWDVLKLCRELLKDRAYWGAEGGVTLSGGEALMQGASLELLRLLKERGAHVAIDTCGLVPEARLRAALEHCDMVLYDIKVADSAKHRELTGAGNEEILRNFRIVAESHRRCWIRTPIIPGATDSDENIRAIGELLKEHSDAIERWELCAFNNLCESKYRSMGRAWEFAGVPLAAREKMEALCEIAKSTGACSDTRWTGAVKE
ncbi:MAG: glycyl-radical enzyme activating protein [Oscillospiraceae bacterium]|nr:glycyl-radical enzyme activating protein [Oscillospiraceae bacterium]